MPTKKSIMRFIEEDDRVIIATGQASAEERVKRWRAIYLSSKLRTNKPTEKEPTR